ncbi:hypothetical protein [Aliivibrio logei]|uniref:hypothetical protein n=1 Tax=Aliivibrio logei TaxID=688 RepID=UPI0035C936B3
MTFFTNKFTQSEAKLPEVLISEIVINFSNAAEGLAYLDVVKVNSDVFSISRLDFFNFSLILRSEHLKNYSFKIFDFGYDVSIYPLKLRVEPDIGEECKFEYNQILQEYLFECSDEVEVLAVLTKIFESKKFISTVSGLMRIATSKS